jgi:type I restriction enzyme S subunit
MGLENSSTKYVEKGTLIVALYGATAGVAAISNIKSAINQAVLAIVPVNVESVYLFYLIAYLKEWIIKTYTQGGQPNLSAQLIKSIQVPLPPTLTEQRAIATALSDVDRLLSSYDQLIAKKKAIKQGAMQELLTGRRRLEGFEGEWEVRRLKNVSEYITVGFVGSMSSLFIDEGIPLLRGLNVNPGSVDLSVLKYISKDTHIQWKKSSLLPGDVVMVRVGYPGTAAVIPDGLGDLNAASLVIVRPNKKLLDPHYLCFYINSYQGKIEVQNKLVGGAQQVLNTNTAANLDLPTPPTIDEQRAIAQILTDMDTEIAALEQQREKYKAVKAGMMQELLTGKTRLI